MAKKAFVLSGGSILGSFQAGAIAEVLDSGFVPEGIYGTSVGSLNGGFLAERAGRAVIAGDQPDWPQIGRELEAFWRSNITSFKKIGRKRRLIGLVIALIRKKFNGFVDTKRLRRLIYRELDSSNLRATPVTYSACAVNIACGDTVYADPSVMGILDYIIASTAIPLIMPITVIGGQPFWDGGIREVAPLKRAIDDGATEIVCITCDPFKTGSAKISGNIMELGNRLMEIVVNELVNDDIKVFERVNQMVGTPGLYKNHRKVNLTVIRPNQPLDIDLESFTEADISEALAAGHAAAKGQLSTSQTP